MLLRCVMLLRIVMLLRCVVLLRIVMLLRCVMLLPETHRLIVARLCQALRQERGGLMHGVAEVQGPGYALEYL